MNKRIFKTMWIISAIVMVLTITIMGVATYKLFSDGYMEQLHAKTALAARGVSLAGADFFDNMDDDSLRVTWIKTDGTVIYDSDVLDEGFGNHLECPEIKDALLYGEGESQRYSSELREFRSYSAKKLDDGTVLRLSNPNVSFTQVLLTFLLPLIAVIIVTIFAAFILATKLSKRIVEPINTIDPDNPSKYIDDDRLTEVRPLLKKLQDQQEQIKRDNEELEKTSLIRQEFTANASHELKTPLHVISGYAELLENGMAKEEDAAVFAGKIRSESQRMTKLVDDIIELSSLDGGAVGMDRELSDLYNIAENAVESLAPEAEAREVTMLFRGEHAQLECIPDVLYVMIYNLCNNAIKYNHKGGRVIVTVENGDSFARVTVRDNGIGITDEEKNRIFERFYRVDKSRSKEVGGTGLGLSIVKHGAMIHNASIDVESRLGEGSAFTVTFPKS